MCEKVWLKLSLIKVQPLTISTLPNRHVEYTVGNEFLDFTIKFLTIARCRTILRECACTLLIGKLSNMSLCGYLRSFCTFTA